MKKIIVQIIFFVLLVQLSGLAQSLSSDLKILEPLIGKKWTGILKSPDGGASWKTTMEYKILWDGSAVKFKGETPDIDASAEGYFYWDRKEKKVAVFVINKKGVYQKGFVTVDEGLITVRGTISFPERTFEYKDTFEITSDGKMIDRWSQNAFGDWRPGHVVEYKAE